MSRGCGLGGVTSFSEIFRGFPYLVQTNFEIVSLYHIRPTFPNVLFQFSSFRSGAVKDSVHLGYWPPSLTLGEEAILEAPGSTQPVTELRISEKRTSRSLLIHHL